MQLPLGLQQEVSKWANHQGISAEEFILQAITDQVHRLNCSVNLTLKPEPRVFWEGRMMVAALGAGDVDVDVNDLIDAGREERMQEILNEGLV